jgi:uridine phosphorylase
MPKIAESELILNSRGAIYHLDLKPEELAPTVILVGDPGRVEKISRYFDKIEHQSQHREFVTQTGFIGSKRLTVLSTGIGPDNIDIVINELDALVNIDFDTRKIKPQLNSLQLVRFGTSGALQADIPVDSFVASTHGLGLDNLLNFYAYQVSETSRIITDAFIAQTGLDSKITLPYVFEGSKSLLKKFDDGFYQGITVTCPGFYGPQGRILRLPLRSEALISKLTAFKFNQLQITNFEMETSAIYGLGNLLGHDCMSVNVIVANRVLQQFSKDSHAAVEKMIVKALGCLIAS